MEAPVMSSDEEPWWHDYMDVLNNFNYSYDQDYEDDICDMTEYLNFANVLIPVVYSVAFVVGILGNGLLLGVLMKSRKVWSTTDILILHRAVADILLLVTLPFWAVASASDAGWVFGTFFCKVAGSVFTMNFYCGIFLLVCISVSYLLSILPSTKEFMKKKPWVVQACCVVVWILSILLSVPDWNFLESVTDSRGNTTVCVRNYAKRDLDGTSYKIVARWLYHILSFLFPSVVLVLCYLCILWQLRCGTRGFQKQRTFKVIIAIMAVFFLCWTPFNITLLMDTVEISNSSATQCGTQTSLDRALIATSVLALIHCCLNPVLYFFLDVKYRQQLMSMWTKTSDSSVF
ncbi:C-X-C chemokine receptor type 3-like [Xiphophorus couchianus]|uniref:C-X-C chemokine receptor type 3-like n=1 Tax=Xiphophorus couchianus TaxID=32473 RepID=UPI0010160D32|nr:C-X-C chemokine receptor type 3-like [Xiphophorus couchianus]XP_027867941.1 C-X-C chemokine receptor type 3-like [Xiphophorus couchianus]